MAAEPINLFSHKIDPRGVLELLRRLAPGCRVVGPDDNWEQVVIERKKSWFGKRTSLTILHCEEYYDGPKWPLQRDGMQGYFAEFPDGPLKGQALQTIGMFRFALATSFEPDADFDSGDWRLDVLFAIGKHLDGCFFTPSSLRDSAGRILFGTDGFTDPNAIFPKSLNLVQADVTVESDDEFEEEVLTPPTPQRVARRMWALAIVANRGLVETKVLTVPKGQRFPDDLGKWANELHIEEELEPDEWEALQRPLGRMERQSALDCTWRIEGVVVLAWALGLVEIPPHDQLVRPHKFFDAIRLFDTEAAREILERPRLRSPTELQSMQGRLLGLHWRLRNFRLRPERMDFVAFSKDCWFGSFDLAGIRTLKNDLAIGKKPIWSASEDEFDAAYSAARERHQAINWLNWGGQIYSEVDTST